MGLFNFPQVDSNVNVIFSVDGDEYAVEQFKIGFHQPVDNLKNQPEGEVRGGRIMITLSQTVKSNIYGWAVKPWVKKNGAVRCGCSWRDPESGSGEECGSVSGQGSNPRDQFHAKMEARQAKRKSSEGEIHCSCSLQAAKLRFN